MNCAEGCMLSAKMDAAYEEAKRTGIWVGFEYAQFRYRKCYNRHFSKLSLGSYKRARGVIPQGDESAIEVIRRGWEGHPLVQEARASAALDGQTQYDEEAERSAREKGE